MGCGASSANGAILLQDGPDSQALSPHAYLDYLTLLGVELARKPNAGSADFTLRRVNDGLVSSLDLSCFNARASEAARLGVPEATEGAAKRPVKLNVPALATALAMNRSLRTLYLNDNRLSPVTSPMLLTVLGRSHTLALLALGGNPLTDAGVGMLARPNALIAASFNTYPPAAASPTPSSGPGASHGAEGGRGSAAAPSAVAAPSTVVGSLKPYSHMFSVESRLMHLELPRCGLTDAGVAALCDAITAAGEDAAAAAAAAAVAAAARAGARAGAGAAADAKHPSSASSSPSPTAPALGLEVLNLSHNGLTDACAERLCETALKHLPRLRSLALGHCPGLGAAAGNRLLALAQGHRSLLEVVLVGTGVPGDAAGRIRAALRRNVPKGQSDEELLAAGLAAADAAEGVDGESGVVDGVVPARPGQYARVPEGLG